MRCCLNSSINFLIIIIIFTCSLLAQEIREEILERVRQIERFPSEEIIWLNDHTIEIKDKLSGIVIQYDLRIKEVDQDSIDQVIDLTVIDTSQFSGMYRLWQSVPIGNFSANRLVISDINNNGRIELSGTYKIETNNDIPKAALFEMDTDSIFRLQKLFSDSITKALGPFPTDLDSDSLQEICFLSYGIVNKEAAFPDSFPDSTNFISNLKILGGNNRLDDLDKDNFIDYIAIGFDTSFGQIPYIAEYDPIINNFIQVFTFYPQPYDVIYNFGIGDIDLDGKTECIGSSVTGKVYVFENQADNQYVHVWSDSLGNANASLTAATNDIDGNGFPEFFIGATGYYQGQGGIDLYWYEAVNDNQYQIVRRIFIIGVDFFGGNVLISEDVDGDGKDELIGDFDSELLILKSNVLKMLDVYYLNKLESLDQDIFSITIHKSLNQIHSDLLVSIRDKHNEPYIRTNYYKYDQLTIIETMPNRVTELTLYQNYPNPFNGITIIPFSIPYQTAINLTIYDVTGKEVKALIKKQLFSQGYYEIHWDGTNNFREEVSSGIYFIILAGSDFKLTRKLLLIH